MLPSCWDTPQIEIFHLWLFHLLKIYSPLAQGMARSDCGNTAFPSAESIVLTRSGFEVMSVAFSVDGKLLASASEDNTFSVWDVASKERIANVFGDGRGELNSVSFSPDGKLLATGRDNNRIEIWSADIRTYNQIEGVTIPSLAILGEYERNLDVDVVAFADGKILAALYDTGNVTVWNVETKAVVETIDLPGNISTIVFYAGWKEPYFRRFWWRKFFGMWKAAR